MGFCSVIELLSRCFCLTCFSPTEPNKVLQKKIYLKEETNATSWNPSFLRVPRYVVCMYFLKSSFLDCKICKTQATPNAGLTCPKSRKAEKQKLYPALSLFWNPPKESFPTSNDGDAHHWFTLAQLRIKRGLGGGKGAKAVKATWKAKDASGWALKLGETRGPSAQHLRYLRYLGVSKNRGTPKWMVYSGKPY